MSHFMPKAACALILMAVAGCGGKDSSSGTEANVALESATAGAVVTADDDDGQMTAIDAASGDARGMPADSSGPTAFDLDRDRQRAEAPKDEAEAAAEPANAADAEPPSAPEAPSAAQ